MDIYPVETETDLTNIMNNVQNMEDVEYIKLYLQLHLKLFLKILSLIHGMKLIHILMNMVSGMDLLLLSIE